MPTVKFEKGMTLSPGQWINCHPVLHHAFVAQPCVITGLLPESVRVEIVSRNIETGEEIGRERTVRRISSVRYVSDTEAEARKLYRKSAVFRGEAVRREKKLADTLEAERITLETKAVKENNNA